MQTAMAVQEFSAVGSPIAVLENLICGHVRRESCELSMRQIAVLIMISRTPETIGNIAKNLNVSVAAASRAVDTLSKFKLVQRERKGQNVFVSTTCNGLCMVDRLLAATLLI